MRKKREQKGSHWFSRHHPVQPKKKKKRQIPASLNARSRRRGGHQGNRQTGRCMNPANKKKKREKCVYYNRLVSFSFLFFTIDFLFTTVGKQLIENWSPIQITSHQNKHNRWIVKGNKKIIYFPFFFVILVKNKWLVEKDIGFSSCSELKKEKKEESHQKWRGISFLLHFEMDVAEMVGTFRQRPLFAGLILCT